ncbi:hypothetical protein NC653_015813 [Populus alba x Populus x berolinensis]|uniref:Uncharacterized protein n=1 Tax=Populus alba x Populus x berolinensis TaxID=444605 RepID=A0AAD6VYI1_9ROSI|nr:hypothetical protein NC653_015813 [Populus alba x Populus x berolinensis]
MIRLLSGLDSLVELYLDENKFDNNILSSLGGLSSLISLSLSGNQLKGAISVDELNNLTSLQWLEFGGNEIESFKSIHGTGYDLLRLRNLEYLGLNPNHFNDSTLSSLKGLSSLKYLDIAYNQLKGSFNVTELDALINLESLDLAGNEIDKFVLSKDTRGFGNVSFISLSNSTSNGRALPFTLLQSLTKFPNLRTLYLDENNLEGSFGTTLDKDLASLKNLEKLDLSSSTVDNSFLQTVGKITTLKSLSLHGCRLNGSIPKAQGNRDLEHQRTNMGRGICSKILEDLDRQRLKAYKTFGQMHAMPSADVHHEHRPTRDVLLAFSTLHLGTKRFKNMKTSWIFKGLRISCLRVEC